MRRTTKEAGSIRPISKPSAVVVASLVEPSDGMWARISLMAYEVHDAQNNARHGRERRRDGEAAVGLRYGSSAGGVMDMLFRTGSMLRPC